jgi:hypothetical protein
MVGLDSVKASGGIEVVVSEVKDRLLRIDRRGSIAVKRRGNGEEPK